MKVMQLDKIEFKIYSEKFSEFFEIAINQKDIYQYECFGFSTNLFSLANIGFILQQKPIDTVHYFIIKDYYQEEIKFKISPNPPMDWLVLGIPIIDGSKNYHFDRLYFCEQLKHAVIGFMQHNNLNFIGSPDIVDEIKDTDKYKDISEILVHPWFADEYSI